MSFSGRSIQSITSVTAPAVSNPLEAKVVPLLIGGVNGLIISTAEKTSALGLRWDAGKNYDIKAEIQQMKIPSGSVGTLTQVVGMPPVGNTNVFSLCLDFVF